MERDFDKIPSRIKYYLLDWKDVNLDEYIEKFGEKKLNQFTTNELYDLFKYTTEKDYSLFNLFGKFESFD